MNPRVAVELGVEGGGKLLALPGSNDVTIYGGDGLTVVGGNRLDVGSTDEGASERCSHHQAKSIHPLVAASRAAGAPRRSPPRGAAASARVR